MKQLLSFFILMSSLSAFAGCEEDFKSASLLLDQAQEYEDDGRGSLSEAKDEKDREEKCDLLEDALGALEDSVKYYSLSEAAMEEVSKLCENSEAADKMKSSKESLGSVTKALEKARAEFKSKKCPL
jgi:hypothetical protein